MRKSIAAATLAACAATSSCGQVHADAGKTVSRNYQVGNFQEIEAAGPYEVNVQTGGNPYVSARGPEKVLDNIAVEVEGDKLQIRSKKHGFFNFGWGSHGRTIFTVTVPAIRAATLAGSGDVSVNSVSGDSFVGTLASSGDLSVGSVNVKTLKLSVAGSGDAKAGGGQVQTAEYSTVGSGDIDARAVTAQQLKASITGSGGIKGHATGTADVKITGSGDVTVSGGAKCSFTKHGSGNLDCS